MQGVGVVHRHADLERVVARVVLVAVADRQDVREHDRVADLPVVAILRLAGQQPVLGDAVLELAERDLLVVRADRDLLALALLLLDELVGVAVQPFGVDRVERVLHDLEPVARHERAAEHADRAVVTKPSMRGSSGLHSAGPM